MIKQITERFSPKQYLFKWALGAVALLGLYLIIAWSSYTALDNSWSTSSYQVESINKAGAFGAWWVDLFFALFGHVGNLFPFVICFVPAHLILSKRAKYLTWTRFTLRTFGFICFISGLCILASFLLSNNSYYLSGGALGGVLSSYFSSLLGKFGALAVGIVLTVVGFIFCSGKYLIQLIVRFYLWLTMQNVERDESDTEENILEESKEYEQEDIAFTEAESPEAENHNIKDSGIMQMQDLIKMSGVNQTEQPVVMPPQTAVQQSLPIMQGSLVLEGDDIESSRHDEFSFKAEQSEVLPQVSISIQNFEPNWSEQGNSTASFQTQSQSAVHFEENFNKEQVDIEPQIPVVSLPTNNVVENITTPAVELERSDIEPSVSEPEFVATGNKPSVSEQKIMAPEIEVKQPTAPVYKPYGDSLIHPAFQQTTTPREKPTTPLPSLDLLERRSVRAQEITHEEIEATSRRIEQQLRNFNVKAKVQHVLVGPVVTRYELELDPGVKASKVTSIDSDLARALMFRAIRVAEVIPGKPYIGIETPNDHRQVVPLRDVLDSPQFQHSDGVLPMALGKDISGEPVVVDLAEMPHLLVAGTTGSGKSVGINTMILSLLYRMQPEQMKFIMIDPKVVELSIYNGIPHLLTPVVTDMKKAANALRWCVDEMERRYQLLSALRARNIKNFNEKIAEYEALNMPIPNPLWRPGDTMDTLPPPLKKLDYIVVIVDEFADLMMVAGKQVEELIARLAQKARAIGIHLILATQRPSVDVITGLIKANVPTRIAFTVSSKIDSRTILDAGGAETLLGKGDMLYSPQGTTELMRVHGAFMSDDEVARVVDDWKARGKPDYIDGILDSAEDEEAADKAVGGNSSELDVLFDDVVAFVQDTGTVSISSIQRKYSIGFNRAARIVDQMEEQGIVSAPQNGKREVLNRY